MTESHLHGPQFRGKDLTGSKFGKLTVLKFAGYTLLKAGQRRPKWLCRCECGKLIEPDHYNLLRGGTKSCGCVRAENNNRIFTIHGDRKQNAGKNRTRLYTIWCGMKYRCENPHFRAYKNWGGRGIKVLWKNYQDFKRDMGPTYADDLQIDRIDNNGHYCKENCRWTTRKEQCKNRRNNRHVVYQGVRMTVSELAEKVGMWHGTLIQRLERGMTADEACRPVVMFSSFNL